MADKSNLHNPWIEAFTDLRADIQTFSSCMSLADLNADKDFKLVIGDFGNGVQVKLKVFKGTLLIIELPLLSQPTAIFCMYTDRSEPRIPGIAVATGSSILVYRNCRPYFKFTLPAQDCNSLEADVWQEVSSSEHLVQVLKDISLDVGFSNLSSQSQNILLMEPALREDFLNQNSHFVVKKQTVITCATTISKYANSDSDVSCALLATESGHLFVMDPETFTLVNEFHLPGICCNISASGVYLVEYSILLAFRNGTLYTLRGSNLRYITQLMSPPVSTLLWVNRIVTACMDHTLTCYNLKGRKYWSVNLPAHPLHMTDIPLISFALHLLAVSLGNGSIHFYNGASLVYIILNQEPIYSMIFGKFGQEEHALITVTNNGALDVKLLRRTAQFKNEILNNQMQPKPHDIKFLVPKKSKLFLEQSLRERQKCREMHTWFHRSWMGLRVLISEAYVNALYNSSITNNESLKMIVEVVGLGPRMKMRIILQNISQNIIPVGLKLTFIYDSKLYNIHEPVIKAPLMVKGINYILETLVTCKMQVAGIIKVLVISSIVLLSTSVNMPDSAGILE